MAESDQIYEALALPNEALEQGGIEILRAGVIDDELYVMARRAFHDPAQWGEVLADIVQRLGLLYAAETDLTEQEVIAAIESAFAAELGAPVVTEPRRKGASRPARTSARKPVAKPKGKAAAKTTAKPTKTSKARAKPPTRRARATSSRTNTARAKSRAKRK